MKAGGWLGGLALAFLSTTVLAGAQKAPKLDIKVTPQESSPLGVDPDIGGMGNANVATYPYELSAGGSITDSLPIELCATQTLGNDKDGNPLTLYPQTVHFGPQGNGGNLPGVTMPVDVTFSADGCQTAYVTIDTGALGADNYSKTIVISVLGQDNGITLANPNVIHIKAEVSEGASISCFTTDSSFNFLVDCLGNLVTSGSTGTFSIVTNRKNVEVATNPGQFYYNLLYTNSSGASQTVSVSFARSGVNPHGAQAIHAMVFPSLPALTAANFDAVNSEIPSGADDTLENVTVPAGHTLWVDYHLEWSGLGKPAPADIGTSCATANQGFGVTATVSVDGTVAGTCGAGAVGYKK